MSINMLNTFGDLVAAVNQLLIDLGVIQSAPPADEREADVVHLVLTDQEGYVDNSFFRFGDAIADDGTFSGAINFQNPGSVAISHISIGTLPDQTPVLVSLANNLFGEYALNAKNALLLSSKNSYVAFQNTPALRSLLSNGNVYVAADGSVELYTGFASGLSNVKIYTLAPAGATFPTNLTIGVDLNVGGASTLQNLTAQIVNATTLNVSGTATYVNLIATGTATAKKFAASSLAQVDGSTFGWVSMTQLAVSGNAVVAGNITENSDARIKENVVELDSEECLSDVLALRPVIYNKIGHELTEIGLIAQEVEAILPALVAEENDLKSVSYTRLGPVLIGAIQRLNERLDQIEKKIAFRE